MKPIPAVLVEAFSKTFAAASLEDHLARDYLKWLRFYLDFCVKYEHPPRDSADQGRSGPGAANRLDPNGFYRNFAELPLAAFWIPNRPPEGTQAMDGCG